MAIHSVLSLLIYSVEYKYDVCQKKRFSVILHNEDGDILRKSEKEIYRR